MESGSGWRIAGELLATAAAFLTSFGVCRGITNLRKAIIVREEDGQDCADTKKILDLEGIQVRVVRWLEIVEHEVNDITRGTDKEELESREVQRIRESPEEI